MRALKNRLILKADIEQKSVIKYGSLTLFMPPRQEQINTDGKVANPVIAEVIAEDADYPHIQKGDYLVLNHNVINNPATILFQEDGFRTFVIDRDKSILGKLGKEGEVIPLCENILAERIYEQPLISLIITPEAYKKTEENKVMIIAVSPEARDVNAGDIAITYKYSDYECSYTINGERRTAIIVWEKDIVAVSTKTQTLLPYHLDSGIIDEAGFILL